MMNYSYIEMTDDIIKEYMSARENYMHYSMKVTYGERKDIVLNTNEANKWYLIMQKLRLQLIS